MQAAPDAPEAGSASQQVAANPVVSDLARTEIQRALEDVCEQAGWSYGEAWSRCLDGTLELHPAWYGSDPGLEPFRRPTEALRFAPGVGLPGRVLRSKQAVFVADVTTDPSFSRPTAARTAGLVGAIGVPVLADQTVVAVLVFFARATEVPAWPKTAELARAAASRLGGPAHAEERLRIVLVAPPWYPIPPLAYGGIEALVYCLAEGLLARGHQVIVIGAGEPGTRARFVRTYEVPPTRRLGEVLPELLHAAHVAELLDELDVQVVHDHSAAGPLGAMSRSAPTVLTAHGPVDGELGVYYRRLDLPLVAISDFQRKAAPDLPWVGRVHNAIPVASFPYHKDKEEFCLFLGRMSPEKAPDLAILAAHSAGLPIVVAAKCTEPAERQYFDERVRPLLAPDDVWFGEADAKDKRDLLSRARCLVFPVQWDEPFGLVMVEAMACGTPVVALRRGSVSEVVDHGVTGWICQQPEQLGRRIVEANRIDPAACRDRAERLFDVSQMVAGYEQVYRHLAGRDRDPGRDLHLLTSAAG
jgi:glycosyltransferase involved in cell wall biosynthesis